MLLEIRAGYVGSIGQGVLVVIALVLHLAWLVAILHVNCQAVF